MSDLLPPNSTPAERALAEAVSRLGDVPVKIREVWDADTIPLLMLDERIARDVYGPAAAELMLRENIGDKILDALARPDHYREVVASVRKHLAANNSYDKRMAELVAAAPA